MTTTWTTWGESKPALPPGAVELLTRELGPLTPVSAAPVTQARVPASRLPADARAALVTAVGAANLRDDDETRAWHAGGQSYADLVRRRAGDAAAAPDAVVTPADAGAVSRVLSVCVDRDLAVVPWGGGTSVVGGLDPDRGSHAAVVALDLSAMASLLDVDPVSRLATFQPGIRTPAAEAALAAHGLTIGHVPQSFERASLGGYVVTRSAGQASTGVGRIDDLVAGLRMATPAGELVLPPLPGSAAGPDLRRLVLGSEGLFGVVTELTLRVHPVPAVRRYEGWMMRDWAGGLELVRRLAQDGVTPDIARLSDPRETRMSMALSRSGRLTRTALSAYLGMRRVDEGCLVITGYEGGTADVRYRRDTVREALRDAGAVPLGGAAGRSWEHSRFAAPALRDSMLDAGVLAETLETAATWSRLPGVYTAVRGALEAALPRSVVGCHVSHLYPDGASLYFTVLAAASTGGEVEQWLQAKRAANEAIVTSGGTVTHHHAVGTAHRDHVRTDLGGRVGLRMLSAVKQAVDPNGILNPGKLLPASTSALRPEVIPGEPPRS